MDNFDFDSPTHLLYPTDVIFYGDRKMNDFVYIKTAESEGPAYHPSQKPVELGRYLVRTFTRRGDIVLDNACGSGSFLVAATAENRMFIGIEKNEETFQYKTIPSNFIEISKKRVQKAKRILNE